MSTSLVVIDGVLRKLVGGTPIPEGIRLYHSLCSTGRVMLISDEYGVTPVNEWLDLNGCSKHGHVILSAGMTRVEAANDFRRSGYEVDMVVVPEPEAAADLLAAGFNTLLFTHAQYAQPRWRPDAAKGVQPWASITQQVADQARAKAEDARLRDIE